MSPALKAEREEIVQKCYIALGQPEKVIATETPGTFMAACRNERARCTGTHTVSTFVGFETMANANRNICTIKMYFKCLYWIIIYSVASLGHKSAI